MSVSVTSVPITYRDTRREFRFPAASKNSVTKTLRGESYPHIDFIADVSVIVDVGASVGSAALFFSLAYPEAAVYCFEPHVESFGLLVENTIGIEQIHPFNFGLYDSDRTADLHIGTTTFTTNSIHRAVDKTERTENISLRDASAVMQEVGLKRIDVIKVDTEGCEVQILENLLPHYRPRVIHLEYHNDNDRRTLDQLLCDEFILYAGRVLRPHLGEATYVRRDSFPSPTLRDRSSRGLY
jgi:FkbM family methyltransferase